MSTRRFYVSTCALAVGMALASSPVRAQEAEPAAAASTTNSGLAEIVVSATRRSTNLQSTPVSVSAVDSSLIAQAAPRDLGDIAAFVPNFSAATIANFNAASFAMRGVGQTSIIVYFEPPVGVLVDDFVVPSVQTQLLDTFDISQVEVLRGPQGTLFGKNTTGGAVTVRTKRPKLGYVGVDGRMEFGDFGEKKVQAAVNVPISDFAALRLVGGYENSNGYYKNGSCFGPVTGFVANKFQGQKGCLNGQTLGGKDVWQARAKLLVEPSSNLSALFQYEWIRDRSGVVPSVNENYLYTGANPFLTKLLGLTDPNAQNTDPLTRAAYTGRHDGLLFMDKGQRISVDGLYANLEYRTDFGTFTSVSGYRFQRSRIPNSYAGASAIGTDGQLLSFFDATRDDDRKTWQQELRFASDFKGPFNFVAGGFYQRDKIDFCVAQILGFLDLTSGPLPFGQWNNTPYILCNAQKAKSQALFFEGTLKLNDKLTLSAGGRYTWDDKIWHGRQQAFIPALGGGFDPTISINEALDASVY